MKIDAVRVQGVVQLQISLLNVKPYIVLTSQIQIFFPKVIKKNPI